MKRQWAFAAALLFSAGASYANNYRLSVWMRSHWDQSNSVSSFNTNNQGVVHEVHPMWFYFSTHTGSQGTVVDIVDNYDPEEDVPTLSGAAALARRWNGSRRQLLKECQAHALRSTVLRTPTTIGDTELLCPGACGKLCGHDTRC